MNRLDYLDFDMLFERSGEEYVARVLNSPAGQAVSRFRLPFSSLELENLLLRVGRTRRGVRRLESPEMESARAFGSRLFTAIFDGEMLSCLRSSLNECYRRGTGLRLRLRLSAPELGDLPWEFLYDPTRNQFLVLSVETPLVRYLELPREIQPLPVTPPLEVLVMISSPVDYPALDVEGEWFKINEALGDLQAHGLVSLTRLKTATLGSLQRELRRGRYHIFHFIGHGEFDAQVQDGVLLTEDENGRGRPVSGYDLGMLLHDHRSLRLAILNSCEGARSSISDPFSGAATSLVQKGLPAVIAMQFEITDPAAITLAHEFYGALADGFSVDAALAEARKAIFAQGNDVEWATPVLYLRVPGAAIFQVDPAAARPTPRVEAPREQEEATRERVEALRERVEAPRPQPAEVQAEVERLYTQALSAFWLDEWEKAIERFEAVLRLQPDHRDAAGRMDAARRNLNLKRLAEQAQAAEQASDWAGAIAALEELSQLAPAYQDAEARLQEARKHKQAADLYAEARRLFQTGNWQAVVNVFTHISALDPDAPDPEGLRAAAQQELEAQQRQAELEALYIQGLAALDAGRFEEAAGLFRQVEAKEPGYRQAGRLLHRAETELARQAQAAPPVEGTGSPAVAAPGSPEARPRMRAWNLREKTAARELRLPALPKLREAARMGLPMGAGWFLSSLIMQWVVATEMWHGLVDGILEAFGWVWEFERVEYGLAILLSGLLNGAVVGIVLRLRKVRLPRRQFGLLVAAWGAAYWLMLFFIRDLESLGQLLFTWTLAGGLGGLATALILRKAVPGINRQVIVLSALGWAASHALNLWLNAMYWGSIRDSLYSYFDGELIDAVLTPVFTSFSFGLAGFVGGVVVFGYVLRGWRLRQPRVLHREERSQ